MVKHAQRGLSVLATALVTGAASVAVIALHAGPAGAGAAAPTAAGSYTPLVNPTRFMDTRRGLGGSAAGPQRTVALQIAGRGNVPTTGVSSAAVTVTVTAPTASGYVTVFRSGGAQPATSTINFHAGDTRSNAVTVQLGSTGTISLANHSTGTTQLVVDVRGYYLSGTPTDAGTYVPVTPTRVVDTRRALGLTPFGPQADRAWTVAGHGGVPSSAASAVILNVTVTAPSAAGYLTIYPHGAAAPGTSTVNYVRGQTVDIAVVVGVGADGKIEIVTHSTGTTQLVIDTAGYYRAGTPTVIGAYRAVDPTRVLDSRAGTKPVAPYDSVHLESDAGVFPKDAIGVVVTATVTDTSKPGSLAVGRLGGTSDVSFTAGATRSGLAIARSSEQTVIYAYNGSAGPVQIIVDVSGYFLGGSLSTGDASIAAHVVTDSGAPFVGARAYLYGPDSGSVDQLPYREQRVDSDGDVTFDRIHRMDGPFKICFSNDPDAEPLLAACWKNQPWSVFETPPSPDAIPLQPEAGTTITVGPERLLPV